MTDTDVQPTTADDGAAEAGEVVAGILDPGERLDEQLEQVETREEAAARIQERFEIMKEFSWALCTGECRALIVSGPPGLGKSWEMLKKLEEYEPEGRLWSINSGYIRPPTLFTLLWAHRFPGQVLVLDDADTVFNDETSLNFLKKACDTSRKRTLRYGSEYNLTHPETGEPVDKLFDFEGSIAFLSNYDFDYEIARGNKNAPHMEALVSRAHYIDLSMKTREHFVIRIEQVVGEGMLDDMLDADQIADVMEFIMTNVDSLRECSLRIALKVAQVRKMNLKHDWRHVAEVTCCKQSFSRFD